MDEAFVRQYGDDKVHMNTMKAAFRCLQQGFGFGMAVHNLTASDYADILKYLEATPTDVVSGLSAQHVPLCLQGNYMGVSSSASLCRLANTRKKNTSDTLESLTVAHQYVLSQVCGRGGLNGIHDINLQQSPAEIVEKEVWTWSVLRFCTVIPPLRGMQDFLRVVDGPTGSVLVDADRSILQSEEKVFANPPENLSTYCWPNTVLTECHPKNDSLYVVYTLLPSMSGGLVSENVSELGIYLTVTEEVVRGHSGERGKPGRYYEWVVPVLAGEETKRVRTYFLPVGCSIVLPSTFVVRLGAHARQKVMVFAHAVRVRLPGDEKMAFLRRPTSYLVNDLDEYQNGTDFLQPKYMSGANMIKWSDFIDLNDTTENCTVGTVPTLANVALNSKARENFVHGAHSLQLGTSGISNAYKRTPVYKLQSPCDDGQSQKMPIEGVHVMNRGWNEKYIVQNVPYSYFEFVTGRKLEFPLSLASIWELELEGRSDSIERSLMTDSDSSSSSSSEESKGSGCSGEHDIETVPLRRSRRSS